MVKSKSSYRPFLGACEFSKNYFPTSSVISFPVSDLKLSWSEAVTTFLENGQWVAGI